MHQQNALATKVPEGDSPAGKLGKSKAGERALKGQSAWLSLLTGFSQLSSRCSPTLLELVQAQQYSTLLFDYQVRAYPKADQNQQEEQYDHHVEKNSFP
jgi:hypothetical protein